MTVLSFDLGRTLAAVKATDSREPRHVDSWAVEFSEWRPCGVWDGSNASRFVQYFWEVLSKPFGRDEAAIDGVDLIVWEATWLHPTAKAARIDPATLVPIQRMSTRLAWLAGAAGIPGEELSVADMTSNTTFRKIKTAEDAKRAEKLADILLRGFDLKPFRGPNGGMGHIPHVWDAARGVRYALTSPELHAERSNR